VQTPTLSKQKLMIALLEPKRNSAAAGTADLLFPPNIPKNMKEKIIKIEIQTKVPERADSRGRKISGHCLLMS
jgi:hypothetical protein